MINYDVIRDLDRKRAAREFPKKNYTHEVVLALETSEIFPESAEIKTKLRI